jgi:hypothetical protein
MLLPETELLVRKVTILLVRPLGYSMLRRISAKVSLQDKQSRLVHGVLPRFGYRASGLGVPRWRLAFSFLYVVDGPQWSASR